MFHRWRHKRRVSLMVMMLLVICWPQRARHKHSTLKKSLKSAIYLERSVFFFSNRGAEKFGAYKNAKKIEAFFFYLKRTVTETTFCHEI